VKPAQNLFFQYLDAAKNLHNLPEEASPLMANYSLGYCFLREAGEKNKENYAKALTYFENARLLLEQNEPLPKTSGSEALRADIYLRCGDCNFIGKIYPTALAAYKKVSEAHWNGTDYALYQQAMILGLQKKNTEKIACLQQVTDQYPQSLYADDALFETGNTQLYLEHYPEAKNCFKGLISKYPNSPYFAEANLKLGQVYDNSGDPANALVQYKFVVTNYCKSEAGQEALSAIRETYIANGDAQGFINFLAASPCGELSHSGQDSVSFLAAETVFQGGDCADAKAAFDKYLTNYPNGFFVLPVHFDRAECLLKDKNYEEALADYEVVAQAPVNTYSERANLLAARINYQTLKNYPKAYTFYATLFKLSTVKENKTEALQGMMYSAWLAGNMEDTRSAANQLLQSDAAQETDKTEAHYYLARIAYAAKQNADAYQQFLVVSNASKTEIGAESKYMMAQIIFDQGLYDSTLAVCQHFLDSSPSYEHWVIKTYLLIARTFEAQQDYFQAKFTLQSILEQHTDTDALRTEAEQLLEEVKQKEAAQTKLQPENQPAPSDSTQNK